ALAKLDEAKKIGEPFPLVLIDGHMPEMDGVTLAQKIKQDPDLVGGTVLMLTSGGPLGDVGRCQELGISAYRMKPVKQSELLDAIRRALRPALRHDEPASPPDE